MKLTYVTETMGYRELVFPDKTAAVHAAFTSDLLSDVMGNAPDNSILITVQGHKNTVAVASLAGIQAIVLCSKRSAPEEMTDAALREGIAVFSTSDDQFTASWKIAQGLQLVSQ